MGIFCRNISKLLARLISPTTKLNIHTKAEVNKKMTEYIAKFEEELIASSKRDVPLNNIAIEMIKELHNEYYCGEDTPLVCDEKGNHTRPVNFRKRFYRILKGASIEAKVLHVLRRTFATKLVNGIKNLTEALIA